MKKLLILIVLLPILNCATLIRSLDEAAIGSTTAKKGNGYLFVTVKKDFFDIVTLKTYYCMTDEKNKKVNLFMDLDRGKFDKRIYCFEMPSGNYRIYQFNINSIRAGQAHRNVNIPITVKAGAVSYLHHTTFDIGLGGVGGPVSTEVDKFNEDVELFKQKYRKFASYEFVKAVR